MRALIFFIVLGVGVASAQTPDPAAAACVGLSEGTVCEAGGQTGTCQPAECCTGVEPDLVCTECLQCAAPPTPRPLADGGVLPVEEEGGGCAVSASAPVDLFWLGCVGLFGFVGRRRHRGAEF